VPVCGVPVALTLTEHRNGKPICGSCKAKMKKNAKEERLHSAIQRSQELFSG